MLDLLGCLEENGVSNPIRSRELIKKAINFNKLNLKDVIVFTEAGSGNFIYTPVIAALAGAKMVYAVAQDSKYGSKEKIKEAVLEFAEFCGVSDRVNVVFDKDMIGKADIVTNLGFVRPIDKKTIDNMKKEAVIPYMCEAWEVRNGDVDIDYARKKGIPVLGVNEHLNGLEVFNYSGILAVKLLLEAGIEIYKNRIVVVSDDEFGKVIYSFLSRLSSEVLLIDDMKKDIDKLENSDAIIIADYTSKVCFIGDSCSQITCSELKEKAKGAVVVQFAGKVNVQELQKIGIQVYPKYDVGYYKMAKTLAYVGVKPVVELHTAGLKVGEIMYRVKSNKNNYKLDIDKLENLISVQNPLCQKIRRSFS